MGRVAVLTTGGTVAMRDRLEAGGAVPELGAADLTSLLPRDAPEIVLEEACNLPSSHFTLGTLWHIRNRVAAWMDTPDVDGVVVTHGTDTLEETAYLLDLTVAGEKPMVVTGAMRVASQVGYEGIANLLAAVRVAASPEARGRGALVVLNDEIHAARDVTKMHTQSLDTFRSPSWGPIGRVGADCVMITRRVERDLILCDQLEPRVDLFKLAVGMDTTQLQQTVKLGTRGVVVEAFGGGRVPPWWLHAMKAAIDAEVAVAVTTRCPSGWLYDPYRYEGAYHDLLDIGCLLAHGLNGQKARLRLMAALPLAQHFSELAGIWYAKGR